MVAASAGSKTHANSQFKKDAQDPEAAKLVAQDNIRIAEAYLDFCKTKSDEDPSGVNVAKHQVEINKLELEIAGKADALLEAVEADQTIAKEHAANMADVVRVAQAILDNSESLGALEERLHAAEKTLTEAESAERVLAGAALRADSGCGLTTFSAAAASAHVWGHSTASTPAARTG